MSTTFPVLEGRPLRVRDGLPYMEPFAFGELGAGAIGSGWFSLACAFDDENRLMSFRSALGFCQLLQRADVALLDCEEAFKLF